MNQSEQINELATALAKAQGSMKSAIKDAVNPFYKSSYANLTSIWNACRESLATNGLSIVQAMEYVNAQLILITTLAHSSGQWMRSSAPIISEKQDAQSIGKAITYMRRYTLSALVGITADEEDDDGNTASGVSNGSTKSNTEHLQKLSALQVNELKALFSQCEPFYLPTILKNIKADRLENVPITLFEKLKKAAIENKLKEPIYA